MRRSACSRRCRVPSRCGALRALTKDDDPLRRVTPSSPPSTPRLQVSRGCQVIHQLTHQGPVARCYGRFNQRRGARLTKPRSSGRVHVPWVRFGVDSWTSSPWLSRHVLTLRTAR